MPPIPSSLLILQPRLNLYLKPLFSHSFSPHKFLTPKQLLPPNSRHLSSLSSAHSPTQNVSGGGGGGGGRSGALAPTPVLEAAVQKIDVNPPKGTRDFPPEDMRLRNWLFSHFREVSRLFGFEEVDFPVLESEALFVRKAGEEIRDQVCFFALIIGVAIGGFEVTRGVKFGRVPEATTEVGE